MAVGILVSTTFLGMRSLFLRQALCSATKPRTPLRRTSLLARYASTGPPNDQRSTVSQQPPPENKQTGSQSTSGIDETSTPPKEKEDKLPLLSRPLGVKEPPSTEASTWAQNMLNQEVRMEQRDKL